MMKIKFCEYGPRPLGWIGYPKKSYKFLALDPAALQTSSGLFQLLRLLNGSKIIPGCFEQGDQIWLFCQFGYFENL